MNSFGRRFASWLVGACACASIVDAQGSNDAQDREVHGFSIPDTLYARTLFGKAQDHIAAQRYGDAIGVLQELLEVHRDEVLGAQRKDATGRPSQQDLHQGAAKGALESLLALPATARKLYRDRYETIAAEALARALQRVDRRELAEIARRFPLTVSAERAWLLLGDVECELGDLEAASLAWRRAQERAQRLGDSLELGAQRSALLDNPTNTKLGALAPLSAGYALDDGTRDFGAIPGPECHSWRRKLLDDDPLLPFVRMPPFNSNETYNLIPVVAGDQVLVSTSIRLIAYNAYSGHPVWRSEEPLGWKDIQPSNRTDFFRGANPESLVVAPAAWGSVAVAALQLPVSQLGNSNFQNIPITTITPERRLYAYDLETGTELWSQRPPPLWDGESGSFAERMRVAGPPIAWCGRVFAPFYRMQGRLEFHIGCFDLYTGALLWSTPLISGQVALNMFGRQFRELCAPPITLRGDRVFALTQLGAIAALDVFTGEIQWETLYDQVALRPAEGYSYQDREPIWKTTPPVVSNGVVIATPYDSEDLIGLDAELGTLLWSKPRGALRGPTALVSLLGASQGAVLLGGGGQVLELRSTSGLDSLAGPTQQFPSDRALADGYSGIDPPRPLMVGSRVILPTAAKRWVIPRSNLRSVDSQLSGTWTNEETPGNLALGRGALYALSNRYLTGLCDWSRLEERLEREWKSDPANADLASSYSDFLQNRADLERRGGHTARALEYLERARAALEPLTDPKAPLEKPALASRIHAALLGEARALGDLADTGGSIARLERSLAWATDGLQKRDSLYALALVARDRDRPRYRSLLVELDRAAADLELPKNADAEPSGDDVARGDSEPRLVGLWVQRELARLARESGDLAGEFAALHALLERYGDVHLADPRSTPSSRIGELLARGTPPEYAPFEAKARALFDAARQSSSIRGLMQVAQLFPHSQAAREALDAGLDVAVAERQVDEFANQFAASLPEPWSFARASEVQARRLIKFAGLLGGVAGNAELSRDILRRLARSAPSLVFDPAADPQRTLAEVVSTLPKRREKFSPAEHATFDSSVKLLGGAPPATASLVGAADLIGVLPLDDVAPDDAARAMIVSARGGVYAWNTGPKVGERWRFPLRDEPAGLHPNQFVLFANRVVIGVRDALIGIDAASGQVAWRVPVDDGLLLTDNGIAGADGVAVFAVGDNTSDVSLRAVEVGQGTVLWNVDLGVGPSSAPLVGGGRVVVLPRARESRAARVFDLITGKPSSVFELDAETWDGGSRSAWIERDRLVVASFRRSARASPDWLRAWSLETGSRSWSVPAEPNLELESVVRALGTSYLITEGTSQSGRAELGGILELDGELGAVRAVQNVKLAPGDLLMGVARLSVNDLDDPFVFVRSEVPGAKETAIRAIHLPYGERWSCRLPIPIESFYNVAMPRPALSQSTVAIVYGENTRTSNRPAVANQLLFLDRASGARRGLNPIAPSLGRTESIEVGAASNALFLAGGGSNGLQVWTP